MKIAKTLSQFAEPTQYAGEFSAVTIARNAAALKYSRAQDQPSVSVVDLRSSRLVHLIRSRLSCQ